MIGTATLGTAAAPASPDDTVVATGAGFAAAWEGIGVGVDAGAGGEMDDGRVTVAA